MDNDGIIVVLRNIINNFINPYNGEYLSEALYILKEIRGKKIVINLIKEKIDPIEVYGENFEKVIRNSKKILIRDLKDNNLDINKLNKVIVIISVYKDIFFIKTNMLYENKEYSLKNKLKFNSS
ncbi:MAG: hypothetical protein Q8N99_01020 [Nanoarchaeota archaeon]|nr:hypothetical protein [Nanoarchaeota archaeon]